MCGVIGCHARNDDQELLFKLLDVNLCNIMLMAMWWYQFECAILSYDLFHALGAFVVKNVALWDDGGRSDSVEEGDVPWLHIGVSPVLQ